MLLVLRSSLTPPLPAPNQHWDRQQIHRPGKDAGADEHVIEAHTVDPRRQGEHDSSGQSITDKGHRDQSIADYLEVELYVSLANSNQVCCTYLCIAIL